jgi:hypothetical protein
MSDLCSVKPLFVMIRPTGTGYEFDNDVVYKSPFATHTLTQSSGVLHPSLEVSSNWGLNKGNSITTLITGESGKKFMEKNGGNRVSRSKDGFVGPKGFINLIKRDGSWTLTRHNSGTLGTAPSVADLSLLLRGMSGLTENIKVRGSPLESKRMLDYLQFLLVKKVSGSDVSLTRPNNANILQEIRDSGSTVEDTYIRLMNLPDQSNRTIYSNAYFVSGDRAAALASVIRDIPTIFQYGGSPYPLYIADQKNNLQKIRGIIKEDLKSNTLFDFTAKSVPTYRGEERTQVLGYNGRPVITKSALFGWFLDTRAKFTTIDKNGKKVTRGSDFHEIPPADKVKILFYWAFNYPHPSGMNRPNPLIAEYFMSIVDTFHDFTEATKKRTISFPELWPSKASSVWTTTKKRTRNGLGSNNIPKSNKAHKFLVDLLGIDIYRRAERDVYNEFAKETLAKTNTRPGISSSMKTAHFLYFIVNVLATESSRATVTECEKYSRDLIMKLVGESSTPEAITNLMKSKNACLVIDHLGDTKSLTKEMKELSVYHNVGILDPATSKAILSWGELSGIECPKETKKAVTAEMKKEIAAIREKREKAGGPRLKGQAKKDENKRIKGQLYRRNKRESDKQVEANNQQGRNNKARQKVANAAASREERARKKAAPVPATVKSPTLKRSRNNNTQNTNVQSTKRRSIQPAPFKMNKNPSNMKMTMGKVSPKKPTTAKKPPLQPTLKRSRNNNQNTNKPPAKKPPLPPRPGVRVSRGPGNAPATGTRSARSVQRTRNAPPASGTRSASARRPPVAPTSAAGRTPGTRPATAGRPPVAPTTATRRTPGSAQV